VHRVLRPGAAFVFSFDHPMALAVGREGAAPGSLPLGALEVRRPYFSSERVTVTRFDEPVEVVPRTIAEVFAALHRAGYRVDTLLEPQPLRSSDPGPTIPSTGFRTVMVLIRRPVMPRAESHVGKKGL